MGSNSNLETDAKNIKKLDKEFDKFIEHSKTKTHILQSARIISYRQEQPHVIYFW